MPEATISWTEATADDAIGTTRRWTIVRELPAALALPLAQFANDLRMRMKPDANPYTAKDTMVTVSEIPWSRHSHNTADLEVRIKPGSQLDAKSIHADAYPWVLEWLNDRCGWAVIRTVDIVVEADITVGISIDRRTGEVLAAWGDEL